jgi:thiamine biosynthesis lipoprotein
MGMPITVTVVGEDNKDSIAAVFDYFTSIDSTFSTYKKNSDISRLNRGEILEKDLSKDVKTVLSLCDQTKKETNGYFDIGEKGKIDPSGLVKGWAIWQAGLLLQKKGEYNFSIEAGGDIQTSGFNEKGQKWQIGIKNPFDQKNIVKVVELSDMGIATSGTYIRGDHIYDPVHRRILDKIASLTIIGPNIYEADRFATAAFAMGEKGIEFIEELSGFEGYQIDKHGQAVYTSGFENFVTV